MKYSKLLLSTILLLAPISATYGQLVAIPVRTTVEALDQNRTVQVYNSGDKPLYLDISLQRVDNPGVSPEKKHRSVKLLNLRSFLILAELH